MPKKIARRELLRAAEAYAIHGTIKDAAKSLGLPTSTFRNRLELATKHGLVDKQEAQDKPPKKGLLVEGSGDENSLHINSVDDKIKTVAQALKKAEVDLDIWEVERFSVNSWEVGMKLTTRNEKGAVLTEKPKVIPLWQVKVWIRRKVPKIFTDAADGLQKRMAKWAPKYPKFTWNRPLQDPHMLELALFDVHFGKLAWEMETGQNSDISLTEEFFDLAVKCLARKASGFNVEEIVIPLGQDFFHVDNPTKTTVNGTPQDVDTRYAKMFETGVIACVKAIDFLMNIAPVKVLYVPGNHDRTVAWHLVSNLAAWYRQTKAVTVDATPTLRKYSHYGINLIGYTHGDQEPHRDLPLIMAAEVPDMWANSKFREIHSGHFHKKKEVVHKTTDSFGPVVVRTLPSLSATDSWHYGKGYVAWRRAAEAYLWGKDSGYGGHFSANYIDGVMK